MNKKQTVLFMGYDEVGERRVNALESWAKSLGLVWAGKGSISRLLQALADERIKGNKNASSSLCTVCDNELEISHEHPGYFLCRQCSEQLDTSQQPLGVMWNIANG